MKRRAITVLAIIFALGAATFTVGASQRSQSERCDGDCNIIIPDVPPAPSAPICTNVDGRVNILCYDEAQTAAIYCNADGSITVRGYVTPPNPWPIAFTISKTKIETVGVPSTNTPLGDGMGITLYRLAGGGFQVNAPGQHGTEYVWPKPPVQWLGCGGD